MIEFVLTDNVSCLFDGKTGVEVLSDVVFAGFSSSFMVL